MSTEEVCDEQDLERRRHRSPFLHRPALNPGNLNKTMTAPATGFDNELVDRELFLRGQIKSDILCNLAYGDASKLRPRAPRRDFDEACQLL